MMDKPWAPACERNRDPILAVLREQFAGCRDVLEIGSGSGQHAVYFAAAMPWLAWQCSDRAEYLPGIRMWLEEAALANTPAPVELDVADASWPRPAQAPTPSLPRGRGRETGKFDAVFTANTLHIMGWADVEAFFAGLDEALAATATVVVYGPFNHGGADSSDSNREFDGWLKARDPRSGIRDFEAVDALANPIGLRLEADVAMPAHNRCLVWRRPA